MNHLIQPLENRRLMSAAPIYDSFSNSNLFIVGSPSSTWVEAQAQAKALGGNLITIHSPAENLFVTDSVFKDFSSTGGPDLSNAYAVWLGLTDPAGLIANDGAAAQHAANFGWIDGDTSTYRNWNAGEPNNGNGGGVFEYYSSLYGPNATAVNYSYGGTPAPIGTWNDVPNSVIIPNLNTTGFYGIAEVPANPIQNTTPPIYDSFSNSNLYIVGSANSTWTDAQAQAKALGGNLITIHSDAENQFVTDSVFKDFSSTGGPNLSDAYAVWLGLTDPTGLTANDGAGTRHAANFSWVDGDSSTYRNWNIGEPNNGNGGGVFEYYSSLYGPQATAVNFNYGGTAAPLGTWNDVPNSVDIPNLGTTGFYGIAEVPVASAAPVTPVTPVTPTPPVTPTDPGTPVTPTDPVTPTTPAPPAVPVAQVAPAQYSNITDEPITEYAGTTQKVRLAYLPTLKVPRISQLSATIDWGDGSAASPASFQRDKHGGIDVLGTHDYISPGTFSVSAIVLERPHAKPGQLTPQYILNLGSINTTATVSTPPQLTETATQKFTAVIASFHQPTVDVIFTAKINWGDGTTSIGTITGDGPANGNWQVTGTHTYKRTGVYKVHTYIFSHVVGFNGPGFLSQNLLTLIHVMGKA